jgi:acyl-CoA synthetase (AMP-forming)/AMP-acid ligase II
VGRFKGDKYRAPAPAASDGDGNGKPPAGFNGEEVAFLQYTSGSTSEPKGVMISHFNLAHNETLIQTALQTNTDTINVSWLPQFHDVSDVICVLTEKSD